MCALQGRLEKVELVILQQEEEKDKVQAERDSIAADKSKLQQQVGCRDWSK